MSPGPELDKLIAEKVMGGGVAHDLVVTDLDEHTTETCRNCGQGFHTCCGADAGFEKTCFPPYSTSIAAAWLVVEHKSPVVSIKKTVGGWSAAVMYDHRNGTFEATAETAPHAICLAALRAMGAEV
jgi:hypothetical protein